MKIPDHTSHNIGQGGVSFSEGKKVLTTKTKFIHPEYKTKHANYMEYSRKLGIAPYMAPVDVTSFCLVTWLVISLLGWLLGCLHTVAQNDKKNK